MATTGHFADGDFTTETPAALLLPATLAQPTRDHDLFNSLGGDLSAGMEVGRLVRRAELNTGVARNTRDPRKPPDDLDSTAASIPPLRLRLSLASSEA